MSDHSEIMRPLTWFIIDQTVLALALLWLAFSADGRWLASCDDDGVIRLWDVTTRAVVRTWQVEAATWALAFAPTGGRLASGSHDGVVRLWDNATGACIRSWDAPTGPIAALAYRPNGELLASASYDATVRLWDPETGALIRALEGETRVPAIDTARHQR